MPELSRMSHIPIAPERIIGSKHFFNHNGERIEFQIVGLLATSNAQGSIDHHFLIKFPQANSELPLPPQALGVSCQALLYSNISYFDPYRENLEQTSPYNSRERHFSKPPVEAEPPSNAFTSTDSLLYD
jgi:hypothetical protein